MSTTSINHHSCILLVRYRVLTEVFRRYHHFLQVYIRTLFTLRPLTRVEAESNTSTVTLRVVGGDEKRSLKYETVKYGHENKGTRTQEALRRRGPVACTKDIPVISSERALNKSRTVIVKK
jgi:hypothetical protein